MLNCLLFIIPTTMSLSSLFLSIIALWIYVDGFLSSYFFSQVASFFKITTIEFAVVAIALSAIIDSLDGVVARRLGVSSQFGKEVDSLCDLISFGFIPGLISYFEVTRIQLEPSLYLSIFNFVGFFLFIVCSVIRLADYGSRKDKTNYFSGIPMPMAGLLLLMPILVYFNFATIFIFSYFIYIYPIYVVILSMLMVFPLPTPAFKSFTLTNKLEYKIIFGVLSLVSLILLLYWFSWKSLFVLSMILYLATIVIYSLYISCYINDKKNKKNPFITPEDLSKNNNVLDFNSNILLK